MSSERTITVGEISAATNWFQQYGTSQQVLVAYHADPDGVVAATFVCDYLRNRLDTKVNGVAVRTHEFDFSKLRNQLCTAQFDALITVDINFASRPGFLSWLANELGKPTLIYDDHLVHQQPEGPQSFCYINPTIARRPKLPVPACFFTYLVWSGTRDVDLSGAKLSDLIDVGLFGESVLSEYSQKLGLKHAPIKTLRSATHCIYAFYASIDWPVQDDPVLEKLGDLLAGSADAQAIATEMDRLDSAFGHISTKLNASVKENAARIISTGTRHRMRSGGEVVVGQITAQDFLMANLVASNVRDHLDSGVAIACQHFPSRTIIELRRTRDLNAVSLDSAVAKVAHFDGVINSGGHPPAAGMAIEPAHLEEVLEALRHEFASG